MSEPDLSRRRTRIAHHRRCDRHHHAQSADRLQLDQSVDRADSWSSSAPRSRPPTASGCWCCRAKAAPSVPAATCRPSARPRPPTPSPPSSANCSSTTTPSSRRCGGCRRSCCRACTARPPAPGMSLAFVADLCIAAEDARFTPAYSKLGVSPDGGGTVGVVASVGVRRALQIYLAEDSFTATQAHAMGPGREGRPCRGPEGGDARTGAAAGAKRAGRACGDEGPDPPRALAADRTAARRRARRHHRLHAHRRVPRRGDEVHEQGEVRSAYDPGGMPRTASRRASRFEAVGVDTARNNQRSVVMGPGSREGRLRRDDESGHQFGQI